MKILSMDQRTLIKMIQRMFQMFHLQFQRMFQRMMIKMFSMGQKKL